MECCVCVVRVIIPETRPWTIVGNVFEEGHSLYTLKTSFVDLEVGALPLQKTKCFVSAQISILFYWQSKVVDLYLPNFKLKLK